MSVEIDPAERVEPAPFVPPQPAELARLLPSYDVTQLLALGGMGAVYSGVQRDLERPVAIKVLPPDAVRDTESIDRFRIEAKAMARLTHPHIPAVYDFTVVDGFGVLVMELVDGPNVYSLIRQKLLPPPRALQILAEVCDAVQFAHSRGVVHGDIKPGNIMLDADGRVKLADFGLARLMVHGDRNAESWTPMGTPEYAAPELYDRNAAPDHRADIYSLGVVLHEMLTGAPPVGEFDLPGVAMGLDPRVDELIARCMELRPEARYQSAAEVRAVVADIIAGRNVPIAVASRSAARKLIRPGRRVPVGARRKSATQPNMSGAAAAPVPKPLTAAPAPASSIAPAAAAAVAAPVVRPAPARAAGRRRKVVVVEGGRPGRGGGISEELKRNLLIAVAVIAVLVAAFFIFTQGGGGESQGGTEDKKPSGGTAETRETPPAPPSTPVTPPAMQPEPTAQQANARPEPRPEPKPEPPKKAPAAPEPPSSKVYAKLHEMKVAWRDEWNAKVEAKISTEMTVVVTQYAELLRKLEDEMMTKSQTAAVLAVREEQARFAKEKTGPAPDAISSVAALATYQKSLNARIEKIRAGVKYDSDTVKEKYMLALQGLERVMDEANDKTGSKVAADEFKKVALLSDTALRDYFNAPEAEK